MFGSKRQKADKGSDENATMPDRFGVSFAWDFRLENVSVLADDKAILSNVSLHVEPGKILALLGPSGSGKSTLLRVISGLTKPDEGALYINNNLVAGQAEDGSTRFVEPEKRGIGMVFQDHALFPHLNALENVSFGLRKFDRAERQALAKKALGLVGLAERAEDWPHVMSGGEQQRVAMARALAPRPPIVLMDEPFSGLDSRLRDSVREDALRILHDMHATVILVTHDPEEAMSSADQICLLKEGHIIQSGSPADLYHRPNSEFVAEFFSNISKFEGAFSNGALHTAIGAIPSKNGKQGGKGVLCVREDGFEVSQVAEEGFFRARIASRRFVGSEEVLRVHLEGHNDLVLMRIPCHDVVLGRAEIWVRPKLQHCLVFESEF